MFLSLVLSCFCVVGSISRLCLFEMSLGALVIVYVPFLCVVVPVCALVVVAFVFSVWLHLVV